MKLIGQEGLLELERSDLGGPGTLAESDLLLNVTVQASSYSAADQSWVVGDEWDRFLVEIARLDERRQGRAVVEGASREDLRLEFYSMDGGNPTATFCGLGLDSLSNPTCCRLFFGNCVISESKGETCARAGFDQRGGKRKFFPQRFIFATVLRIFHPLLVEIISTRPFH